MLRPNKRQDSIESKLQEAIHSNQILQTELRKCLKKVYQKKAENRKEYLLGLQNLVRLENSFDSSSQNISSHKRSWYRRYFIDGSDLSIPEPNADTIRRQQWEGEQDLNALTRPWSKLELSLLKSHTDYVLRQQTSSHPVADTNNTIQNTRLSVREQDIDFDHVARLVHRDMTTGDADDNGPCLRPSSDYRNKYFTTLSPSLNTAPFTKEESLKILELIHKEDGHPRWDEVAKTLGTNRSPFACFRHYQLKLKNNTSTPTIEPLEEGLPFSSVLALSAPKTWSYLEDELLLKYIAASGPQTFINQRFAADVGERFFPHMPVKRIVLRMSSSLLIPTLKHERWSDKDERKLALCMRIYGNATSPETEAQVHFPHRAAKSVLEKWSLSLNPDISTQPYTPQEDKALLEAVSKAGGAADWKAISSKFPNRNRRSLFYHWTCIASKEDVLKRYEESYILKSVAKRGAVGYGEADDQMPLDEFVVCARKRNKT